MNGWSKEVRTLDERAPHADLWREALTRSKTERSRQQHVPSRSRVALVLILATGLGVGIAIAARAHSSTTARPGGVGPGVATTGLTKLGVNPLGADGQVVTLTDLATEMPYTIPLPNVSDANSADVGTAWIDPSTHAAAVYYPAAGIEVFYGGTGVDFTGFPSQDIQSIGGVQSLVIPAGTEDGFVHILVPLPGNHVVTLVSSGPVSALTAVAVSIVSANSANGS